MGDSEFTVPGYTMFRQDRKEKRGGGVMVYVDNALRSWAEPTASTGRDDLEVLWVGIAQRTGNVLLGAVYRPPSSSREADAVLEAELTHATSLPAFPHKIIAGDFNAPAIDWSLGIFPQNLHWLEQFISNHLMEQIVDTATHIKGNTLDIILTNNSENLSKPAILPGLSNSDHYIVKVPVHFRKESSSATKIRHNYKKADWKKYQSLIESFTWDQVFNHNTVSEIWKEFEEAIKHCIDQSVPTVKVASTKNVKCLPWKNAKLEKLEKRKRNAFRRLKKNPTPTKRKNYQEICKILKKSVRTAVSKHENQLAEATRTGNSKSFWSYVNAKTKTKHEISTLFEPKTQEVVTEVSKKVEMVASYFASTFQCDTTVASSESAAEQNQRALKTILFTREDVRKALLNKSDFSSPGPDGLHYIVFKKAGPKMEELLAMLFQRSLRDCAIPEKWKKSTITPIYKGKGSKSEVENYRPVSLTATASKIMETIIQEKLFEFMKTENLLKSSQFGFRSGYSCSAQLLEFFDFATKAINNGDTVDCVYLDFSKAFDSVSHKKLLQKLETQFRIKDPLLSWIKSFLEGREFQVMIEGELSTPKPVLSGVPQGSVLGPVLFILFVNDFDDCLKHSRVLKFADDMKIFATIPHGEAEATRQLIQSDLWAVEEWQREWGLKLNASKCVALNLHAVRGRKPPVPRYSLNGSFLSVPEAVKDLGVWVSGNLDFSRNSAEMAAKAKSMVRLIFRKIHSRRPGVLIPLFNSLVKPHLIYCSPALAPYKKADKLRLDKPVRLFTRLFPTLKNLDYSVRLNRLGLKNWEQMRTEVDLKETWKIIHGHHPISSENFFNHVRGATRSRNSFKLRKEKRKMELRNCFLSNRVCDIWNQLPDSIVAEPDPKQFSRKLAQHLPSLF